MNRNLFLSTFLFVFLLNCPVYSAVEEGTISFYYWLDLQDWEDYGNDMYMDLTILGEGEYDMTYTAWGNYYFCLVDLREGEYEFYFSIMGRAVDDMSLYDGKFSPLAVDYVPDGFGGKNAKIKIIANESESD